MTAGRANVLAFYMEIGLLQGSARNYGVQA